MTVAIDHVSEKVRDILVDELSADPAQLTREAKLVEDLNASPLDLDFIYSAVECTFGIDFGGDLLPGVTTVGDLIDCVADVLKNVEPGT